MKYVDAVNRVLKKAAADVPSLVLYGQNVAAGSCLGGLCRGLSPGTSGMVVNTQNSENSLVGVGMGMMLRGVSSVYFMKQLDFLLLGVDHLANTGNFVRIADAAGSFTIVCIVVDQGYQGMQSSFNSLADLCSVARMDGYTITTANEAKVLIPHYLASPGWRILAVSQRLFGQEIVECPDMLAADPAAGVFQYSDGPGATIVCCNFALPYGMELAGRLGRKGREAALFSINPVNEPNWEPILASAMQTRRVVILDDSRSRYSPAHALGERILSTGRQLKAYELITKAYSNQWFYPNSDGFEVDLEAITGRLLSR